MPDNQKDFPTVGVIGGGQLARMMVAPAIALGINLRVFAQSKDDSAAQICDHTIGDYKDLSSLINFAKSCQVITFEHELVPPEVLLELEKALTKLDIKMFPSAKTFLHSQDKLHMRSEFEKLNIAAPRWTNYPNDEISKFSFPLIAKSPTGGYDGRGVWQVDNLSDLVDLYNKSGKKELLIEERVNFSCEISVLVARSPHNQATVWSPTLSVQKDGICIQTITPAPDISDELRISAQQIALKIAGHIELVGVMAVEIFVVNNKLLINEIALRPHNSGHWSIEGSVTSQFEQHLRAVLDLPLGDTTMLTPWAVMGNLIGGSATDMYWPYLHLFARTPGLKVHQYRKEIKLGRKVGHVTATGSDLAKIKESIEHAVDFFNGRLNE